MKVVILAGGMGTRISEESDVRPKPMVEIGGRPILWHIMKIYSHYGFNDFVILLGYKGYMIKEYFANYYLHQSDVTIDTAKSSMEILNNTSEKWRVTLIDTGVDTMTGGRIKRAAPHFADDTFLLTYGDGVSDVRIDHIVKFHKEHGKLMTMTAIQPEGRFGAVDLDKNGKVERFLEKPQGDRAWINGGFFVCEPGVIDTIRDESTIFERAPMEAMSDRGELMCYKHSGFWSCMDTLRDKNHLNDLWRTSSAKWKTW